MDAHKLRQLWNKFKGMEEVPLDQEPSDNCVLKDNGLVHITDMGASGSPTSKLLAISNKYGVLLVATTKGLACVNTSNVLKAAKDGGDIGSIKQEDITLMPCGGAVSTVGISADELTVAVASGTSVHLYEMAHILQVWFIRHGHLKINTIGEREGCKC